MAIAVNSDSSASKIKMQANWQKRISIIPTLESPKSKYNKPKLEIKKNSKHRSSPRKTKRKKKYSKSITKSLINIRNLFRKASSDLGMIY